jgi:glycogen(starch) synthase
VKLLIYSHAFAPQVGGVETFSMYLARGLARFGAKEDSEGFTVTVVTSTPLRGETESWNPGFEIAREASTRTLWKLIGKTDRVLLAGPAILPLLFALIRHKPVAVTHHGYQLICPNGMLFQFSKQRICPGHFAAKRYMECVKCNAGQEKYSGSVRLLVLTFVRRLLSRLANWNVAVSEHVSCRIALPETRVIRNGVPDVGLRSVAPVHLTEPCSFAYLGRLITEKGVPVLIEAASILKMRGRTFQILLIGDGPERKGLQAQVSSLQLDQEVQFLGFLKGAPLQEAMSRVSALVMPSICEDAAPFSVLEQMMQGRLIIGSNLGGLAEQIGDSGLTFAAGDATALAGLMERVIEQPDVIERLGRMARERALQSYTQQRMINEYKLLLST